jgi:hypothetical protein
VELGRYDAVIWLESCAAVGAYDGSNSNPCRFEDPQTAIGTGEKLAAAWRSHASFWTIQAFPSIDRKVNEVRRLLDEIMGPTDL